MLLEASGGSSAPASMPARPAARIAAKARYGLHAGSGERYSIRVASSCPGLYCGTRTSDERLRLAPQQSRRAVAPRPADVHRRLVAGDEPLVAVHPLVRDQGDLGRVREDAGDVVLRRARQVVLVARVDERVWIAGEQRRV